MYKAVTDPPDSLASSTPALAAFSLYSDPSVAINILSNIRNPQNIANMSEGLALLTRLAMGSKEPHILLDDASITINLASFPSDIEPILRSIPIILAPL